MPGGFTPIAPAKAMNALASCSSSASVTTLVPSSGWISIESNSTRSRTRCQ